MHSAPSVSYPVGRCALRDRLLLGQACLSLVILLAWGRAQSLGLMWCVAAGLLSLAVVANARAARRNRGVLSWDGQDWHWRPNVETLSADSAATTDCVGEVKVVLDAQRALLLRWRTLSESDIFQPSMPPAWLWLGQEHCPERWLDVRRAVYGREGP